MCYKKVKKLHIISMLFKLVLLSFLEGVPLLFLIDAKT